MAFKIDYDRGVMKQKHPSGADVYMYFDDPGVFLNAHGTVVSEQMAKEAAYDVENLGKKRRINLAKAAAIAKVEQELSEADGQVKKIVKEKGGFKVIDIGVGRHQVLDPDGDNLTGNDPLTLEQAVILLDQLVPDVSEAEASPDA